MRTITDGRLRLVLQPHAVCLSGFRNPRVPLKSAKRNLSCALQHPDTVQKYLTDEITVGRVAGLFVALSISQPQVSRFGVIPKNHQPTKWRLIDDLSHPISGRHY